MHPALSILITLICLSVIITLSTLGVKKGKLSAEMARKLVHVGMGLLCLSFPWLFNSATEVQTLAGIAVITLLSLRLSKLRHTLGTSLFSVERISIGELLFPLAVSWLFTLSQGNTALYITPLLLLTLADTAGALGGIKYGKTTYTTTAATKSLEGSLCFLLIAFPCITLPLYLSTDLSLGTIIFLALTVSLLNMAIEGASGHGLDNLLIPIGSFLLLDYYITLPNNAIFIRSISIIVILLLLIITRKKHSFNGGATLTAALYGFAAFTMGGTPCLIAALILFGRHIMVQHKMQDPHLSTHSIEVIIAIAAPSIFWLTLSRSEILDYPTAQLGFIITLSLTIYMSHIGTYRKLGGIKPSLLTGLLLSASVLATSLLFHTQLKFLITPLLISVPAVLIYFYWIRQNSTSDDNHWLKLSTLASLFSLLSMLPALL